MDHSPARSIDVDSSQAGGILMACELPSVSETNGLKLASTPPRPRTKPPEVRREELMNSAEQLFLEQGVESTTIDQITSGAKVAKGTFYLHFSSKEDVREALRERFVRKFLDQVKAAVDREQEEAWDRKLAAWVQAAVVGYLDAVRLHDIVFHDTQLAHKREGLTNNIVIDHLTDLLAAGVYAQAWSVDDPHSTAVFLFNGLHGVVDDAMIGERRVNRARLISSLEKHCFRIVGWRSANPHAINDGHGSFSALPGASGGCNVRADVSCGDVTT